jgi:hypothetical protein
MYDHEKSDPANVASVAAEAVNFLEVGFILFFFLFLTVPQKISARDSP